MIILNCAYLDGSVNSKFDFLVDEVETALDLCPLLFQSMILFIPQENKTAHD